jgi:omega-amidase
MTSRSAERPLCSLRFATDPLYENNLSTLLELIERTPEDAVVVAPEVCLSGFDYARFDAAAAFTEEALMALLSHVQARILILTVIEKRNGAFYNVAKVLHGGSVVHEQKKAKLFALGEEHLYFVPGDEGGICVFEVEGIKLGVLICFELRFKQLWQKLEGAQIIAVPAQWGHLRGTHFVTLTNALAVMNQCYVIASDAANADTSGESGIISPFGEEARNGNALCLQGRYEEKEVRKMRRYLDVGID